MSIYEDEKKVGNKAFDEAELNESSVSNNLEKSDLNYNLNENGLELNSEQDLVKDKVKEEVVVKNPRATKNKKTVEYIEEGDYSNKAWSITLILCVLLGFIGFHRFYVGKAGTAILMLLTFGGFGIWVLVDLIRIVINNFTDEEGKIVKRASLAS